MVLYGYDGCKQEWQSCGQSIRHGIIVQPMLKKEWKNNQYTSSYIMHTTTTITLSIWGNILSYDKDENV